MRLRQQVRLREGSERIVRGRENEWKGQREQRETTSEREHK